MAKKNILKIVRKNILIRQIIQKLLNKKERLNDEEFDLFFENKPNEKDIFLLRSKLDLKNIPLFKEKLKGFLSKKHITLENYPKLISTLIENNELYILSDVSIKNLLYETKAGVPLIKYFFNQKKYFPKLSNLKNHKILNMIIENNDEELFGNITINESLLLTKVTENDTKTYLDIISEKKWKVSNNFYNNLSIKTIYKCLEKKILPNQKYINFDNIDIIFETINGKTLFELLYDKDIYPATRHFDIDGEHLAQMFVIYYENNDILSFFSRHGLPQRLLEIKKLPNGKLLSVILYSCRYKIRNFFKKFPLKTMYFAKYLLDNNMAEILPEICSKELLFTKMDDGKLLLEAMIDKEPVLMENAFYNILRQNEIDEDILKVFDKKNSELRKRIDKQVSLIKKQKLMENYIYTGERTQSQLNEEFLNQLEELKNVLKTGVESETKIFEIICGYFISSYKQNDQSTLLDLKRLIEIKKDNPDFQIVYSERKVGSDSNYDGFNKILTVGSEFDFTIFNHELTHAFCDFAKIEDEPETLKEMMQKQREYLETTGLSELKNFFEKIISEKIDKNFEYDEYSESYTFEKYNSLYKAYIEKQFNCTFEEYKKKQKEEYKKIISDKKYVLEKLLSKFEKNTALELAKAMYSKEDEEDKEIMAEKYVNQQIEEEIIVFAITKFDKDEQAFLLFENLIDAFIKGKLWTLVLKDIYNKKNISTRHVPLSLHMEEYFLEKPKMVFQEVLCDYSALIKAPNSDMYIEALKRFLGEEIINQIHEMYLNITIVKNVEKTR